VDTIFKRVFGTAKNGKVNNRKSRAKVAAKRARRSATLRW
jgi:hypothetical protein